jgi:ArsR family transcriptional regulator, arsenate/arsenite/antimonite-responsive transcriptional repressor
VSTTSTTLGLRVTDIPRPRPVSNPLPLAQNASAIARPLVVDEPRNLTAEVFRALADPIRLELLGLVAAYGPVCVCHLEEALPYKQPRISKHLATLKRAGLVSSRREGTWVYYQLNEEGVGVAGDFLEQLKTSTRGLHAADYCPEPESA